MNKSLQRISDLIVNFFIEKGINQCFCVTGGGAMYLNDSFGHHPQMDVVYNHHEQACAMAAEGYFRSTGKPAIVLVTSGPGATNAITGVYGAWTDGIPMFVLSGQMKHSTNINSSPVNLRYLGFQESNIIPVAKNFTKYSKYISDHEYIYLYLEEAYHKSLGDKMGPVWLDIPLNVQSSMFNGQRAQIKKMFNPPNELSNNISNEIINELSLKIKKSKSPLFMLGEEVRHKGWIKDIQDIIEHLGIPFVTEWNAHDILEDDHPLNVGRPGTIGTRGGNFVVQNSDLLICVGCQLSLRQISYEYKNFAKNAYIVGISIDKYELIKPTVNIDLPIHGGVDEFSRKLLKTTINEQKRLSKWIKWAKDINIKYPVVNIENKFNVDIYNFIDKLSKKLSNDITVLANGAACVCGMQAFNISKGSRVFTNAGSSSMGYGISASVGAAKSGKRVICIEGDGSIMMNLSEIQTIRTNNLNVKIFIINNGGYQSIIQTQKNIFKGDTEGYCGANPESGVGFPDFSKIAMSFGFKFFKISDNQQIEQTLNKFLEEEEQSICEIMADPLQEFEPKLISKALDNGEFYTPSLEDMYPFLSQEELLENKFKP